MQIFKIIPFLAGVGGVALVGCEVEDPPATKKDAGMDSSTAAGSGGAGGAGVTTAGTGGSGGATTAAGTGGSGGSGGSGSAGAGGSSGAAGSETPDASAEASAADAEAGPPMTCAKYALMLNGGPYVDTPRSVQDDFTLEAWIKYDTASAFGDNYWEGTPLVYADVAGADVDFGMSLVGDKLAFGVGAGVDGVLNGSADYSIFGTTTLNDGNWHHVAATRSKSSGLISLYVDGVSDATPVATEQVESLTANPSIWIGGNPIDGRYYYGQIDEVRIWSTVRSEAEITANMRKVLTGSEANLAAYYRFDEGSGQLTADSTKAAASNGTFANTIDESFWTISSAPVCP